MKQEYIHKQFWKYVLPSMFTMLLGGFYAIIDGLFVGNAVGNDALAAINLVYPMQAVLNATAVGVGIGGSVVISMYAGRNDEEKSLHASGLTILLLVAIGILLPLTLYFFRSDIIIFLGAEGTIYDGGMSYISMVLIGGLLPILGNGLNPLIRNYGKTMVATLLMSIGLLSNIALDYVFVFVNNMGLFGAALATVIAQGAVAIFTLLFLWYSKRELFQIKYYRWNTLMSKEIIRIGASPFGQTLVPSIVIILTNWKCIQYGGNDAVTIFSVVSYILASVQAFLQGVGDGVQPLLSFYHGSSKEKQLHILYHKSFQLILVVSFSLVLGVFLFKTPLTTLFGIDAQLQVACERAVMITACSFPFFGIVRLTSAYFYATNKTSFSTSLVYVEPCIVLPVLLFTLSSSFEIFGVWISYPISQLVLCGIAIFLKRPQLKSLLSLKIYSKNLISSHLTNRSEEEA